jgi:4-diphosphocytidyl-2-C-methyl-D-erythritol kinase
MEETAYAKLNLALHVRAREPDGYHRIETLFAFCEHGDGLSVAEADDLTLSITGPFAASLERESDNLVTRAAGALRQRFGVGQGAALTLDKRLPIASGIGGGSADAAAAFRLLNRWWRLDARETVLLEIAGSLGADVPACLRSKTARGEGRGDRLRPVDLSLPGTPVLLVNPGVAVPTGPVFRAWDGIDRGPLPADSLEGTRNDLEAPALEIAPEIRLVLDMLARMDGASLVRMSGSGATCFALFENEAARDAAQLAIAYRHPSWWQLASRLR